MQALRALSPFAVVEACYDELSSELFQLLYQLLCYFCKIIIVTYDIPQCARKSYALFCKNKTTVLSHSSFNYRHHQRFALVNLSTKIYLTGLGLRLLHEAKPDIVSMIAAWFTATSLSCTVVYATKDRRRSEFGHGHLNPSQEDINHNAHSQCDQKWRDQCPAFSVVINSVVCRSLQRQW